MTAAAGSSPSPGPGRPPLLHRLSGPWHSRDFRWYWAATSAQAVSQGMQFLVLGWMVLEVTGSPTQLGLTLFAYGLPNTALLVLGGAIADRMNRKWLLMLTQAAVAGFILALAAVTLAGVLQLWHIYLLAVGLGVLQGLNQPARVALISDVADQRSLLDAVAQSNAAVHLGRIVGPPAAGVLIDYWGLGAALLLNAACYIGSVLFLMGVHSARTRPAASGGEPFLRNFADAAVYIYRTPVLLTVLALACSFGGLAMSHLQIIPAFAQEQLGSDASGVGLLLLASGIGALLGNLGLTLMARPWLYRWLLAALGAVCAALTLFAWSPWFWASWVLFLLLGVVSLGTVWPLATTLLQLAAPAEMRGKVMGLLHFTPGFHYLGALPLAYAAGLAGWPLAMSGAALLCLLVSLWFGLGRKSGRQLAAGPLPV